MPSTYELISSNTLTTTTATVTFSSIPSTWTDLVVKISARGAESGIAGNFNLQLNGNTGSVYSRTRAYAYGTSAYSERSSNDTAFTDVSLFNQGDTTANTFANIEIYIPSYTSSINKAVSGSSVVENNSTTDNAVAMHAYLYRNTSAITSISLRNTATGFVSGSSFYLYGISNA